MGLRIMRTAAIAAVCLMMTVCASAQVPFDYTLEQAQLVLPEITVYYNPTAEADWDNAEVTAMLGEQPLEKTGAGAFAESGEGTFYLFLVDCSTSVRPEQMDRIREALHHFAENLLAPGDRMMLESFGERVEVALSGGESPEEIAAAIDSLQRNQEGTVLFDAVNKAITFSENAPEEAPLRKVAVMFSDAEEFAIGSYTLQELTDRIHGTSLPLYVLGLDTGTKDSLDGMGLVARQSGGDIRVVSSADILPAVEGIVSTVRGSRYLRLRAPTNRVSNQSEQLVVSMKIGDATLDKTVDVTPRRWKPDNTAPSVLDIERAGENSVKVLFSEPVDGADKIDSFLLSDGSEEEYSITQVTYIPLENAAVLKTERPLADHAEYTLFCLGLTDSSMEMNVLPERHPFVLGDPGSLPEEEPQPQEAGWVLPLALLITIAIIIIIVVAVRANKKKQAETVVEYVPVATPAPAPVHGPEAHHHFAARNVRRLPLLVPDQNKLSHKVDMNVDGTIFVGRDPICNLYFDDPQLSPQHFAIEATEAGFILQDLDTAGGTWLNGVRVQSPRKLSVRDKITAGQITFVVGN